jgi:hypothetical protein
MSRSAQAALTEAQQQASGARSLADSPALVEVFNRIEVRLTGAWKNSGAMATAEREQAWHMRKALELIRAEIRGALKAPAIVRRNSSSALNAGRSN